MVQLGSVTVVTVIIVLDSVQKRKSTSVLAGNINVSRKSQCTALGEKSRVVLAGKVNPSRKSEMHCTG
jgi:hypothetical protein